MTFDRLDGVAFAAVVGALLAAVGAGEVLRAWAGWRPESSRRIVHASVGVMVALAPPLFAGPGPLYALAVTFASANAVAVRRRLLPGMHAVDRETWGTVVFPLALIAALAVTWSVDPARLYALQAAFLVLALADPLASIVGGRLPRPGEYRVMGHIKSVAGSAVFFAAAFALTALALAVWGPSLDRGQTVGAALLAAGLATAAEALGSRGWDNLGIVLAVIIPLVLIGEDPGSLGGMLAAFVVAAMFSIGAWRVGFLDLSGALAAGLLAWTVLVPWWAAWALPGMAFFFLSSILSRAGRRRKAAAERFEQKSSRRDAAQVLANGGVAGVLLLAYLLVPVPGLAPALYWAFVAAFAAAAADTWATEIGTLLRGRTWGLPHLRVVAPGESGGVSLAGSAGAAAGAVVVFACAWPLAARWPELVAGLTPGRTGALVIGGALLGCAVDSLLGGTLQARYRAADGVLTERSVEAGRPLPLAAGLAWLDNDRVNLACTLVGAAVPFTWLR